MPHPRTDDQLARHALEQRLRRDWARESGRPLESLDRAEILRRAKGKCAICRRPIRGDWHEEHRVPLSAGGANDYDNVGPAHPECNLEKGVS